jgi:hypothetical protein
VDHGALRHPADNPYADGKRFAEIFAAACAILGHLARPRGHDLIAVDVGRIAEEINVIVNGGNYGWRSLRLRWIRSEETQQRLTNAECRSRW